jgi:hypothetical protein
MLHSLRMGVWVAVVLSRMALCQLVRDMVLLRPKLLRGYLLHGTVVLR